MRYALLETVLIWVGFSYFEAKTFTKLTGREVGVFEAMFVDLRVMEPIK